MFTTYFIEALSIYYMQCVDCEGRNKSHRLRSMQATSVKTVSQHFEDFELRANINIQGSVMVRLPVSEENKSQVVESQLGSMYVEIVEKW